MALTKVSAGAAFARLVKLSQGANVKLRDLSHQLLASLRES